MATIMSGVITMTGSAIALDGQITEQHQLVHFAVDKDNAAELFIGNDGNDTVAATSGLAMHANGTREIRLHRSVFDKMYVNGTASDKLTWVAVG